MAELNQTQPNQPKPWKPWIVGAALGVVSAGASFAATYTDLLEKITAHRPAASELADIAFLPIDSLVISLGPAAQNRHLRLTTQLEVKSAKLAEAAALMPRILDTMNTYLRAISVAELEDPGALLHIRLQLLHRIQVVVGEDRVSDLLITEFLLS